MPVIRKDHPGWTLPGYKYLGPFNSLNRGKPTNPLDEAARAHDINYTNQINKGLYPYLFFNQADQELIDKAKQHKGLAAYLTHFFFSLKKQYFPRQQATKRKGIFINKALQAKKAKTQGQKRKPTNQEEEPRPSTSSDYTMDQPSEDNTDPNAPGPGGGGGGGVGHSTGGFNNKTYFHYEGEWCYVTAHCCRQVYLNQATHDNYILTEATRPNQTTLNTSANITQRDNYHAQVQTSWFHLDANCWGVWFAPSDFQKIIAEASEIFIESFEWKLCNISIKTATELQQGQVVYNNDLIATLQIAHDTNSCLPFTPEAPRGQTLTFLPWHPSTLPSYTYYIETFNTLRWRDAPWEAQGSAARTSGIDVNWQFICIEHQVEIELLRTGDEYTSGIYKFHCKPHKNLQLWQTARTLGKPPRMETQTAQQQTPYEAQNQRGIHWGTMGLYNVGEKTAPNESDQVRPYDFGYQVPFWNFDATYSGPQVRNQPPSKIPYINGDPPQEMSERRIIFDYGHGNFNPDQTDQYTPAEYGVIGQGQGNPGSWIQPILQQDKDTNATPDQQHRAEPLQPTNTTNTYNSYTAFNNYDIHYPHGQIWDKKPTTEHEPEFSSLATFKCEDAPPGQILLKLTPQYTNHYNQNIEANPKIDTYCSFFWQGRLKLKYKVRRNRQFNTYTYPKPPDTQAWAGKPTYTGYVRIPNMDSRAIKDIYY